jgi:hypothetical protein
MKLSHTNPKGYRDWAERQLVILRSHAINTGIRKDPWRRWADNKMVALNERRRMMAIGPQITDPMAQWMKAISLMFAAAESESKRTAETKWDRWSRSKSTGSWRYAGKVRGKCQK